MKSGQKHSSVTPTMETPSEQKSLTPAERLLHSLERSYGNFYILSENVWIQLSPSSDCRVGLKMIASVEPGCGSPALDYLCSLADLAECEIILEVRPQKVMYTRKLTKPQLKKWYKKRCFVKSPEHTKGDIFIRFPQKVTLLE